MTEQIAQGDVSIGQRVGQAKPRQVLAYRIVPGDLSFIDEQSQRGCGKSLGQRSDGENRIRRDRIVLAEATNPVSLEVDHLAVADDDESQAGSLVGLQGLTRYRVGRSNIKRRGSLKRGRAEKDKEKDRARQSHRNSQARTLAGLRSRASL